MDLHLTGTTAVVTGGTTGVGRAIVGAFAGEGSTVTFCARDSGQVAAAEPAFASSDRVGGYVLDVGDGAAIAAWIGTPTSDLGGMDAVMSNVGAFPIEDTEENRQASLRVDLPGSVRCA